MMAINTNKISNIREDAVKLIFYHRNQHYLNKLLFNLVEWNLECLQLGQKNFMLKLMPALISLNVIMQNHLNNYVSTCGKQKWNYNQEISKIKQWLKKTHILEKV